ncbi:hypothetical protein RchiOBHm_Chr5g0015341 [Rosa chinensis]|uniref:Uncharacterized protein n=1 Tax=Rosa chinensis TaxID=74649 RepID=A0A2P6Q5W7_ROSCH|nr:hypothetical protein RchiOBHm_Chr5g0015341 [Rosa chinensis]
MTTADMGGSFQSPKLSSGKSSRETIIRRIILGPETIGSFRWTTSLLIARSMRFLAPRRKNQNLSTVLFLVLISLTTSVMASISPTVRMTRVMKMKVFQSTYVTFIYMPGH